MANCQNTSRTRSALLLSAASIMLLLSGCGAADPNDDIDSSEQALINAQPLPASRYKSLVVWATDEESGVLCSGTVVGKRYIVTAAHCVSKTAIETWIFEDGEEIEYEAFLPEPRDGLKPGRKLYVTNARDVDLGLSETSWAKLTVKTARLNPPWLRATQVPEGENHPDGIDMLDDGRPDVALIELTEPIKDMLPEVESALIDARQVGTGTPVTLTGYGCEDEWRTEQGEWQDNWGERVTAEFVRTKIISPQTISEIYNMLWPGEEWSTVKYIESHDLIGSLFVKGPQYGIEKGDKKPLPGLCGGDSGGGMFRADNQVLLIGVNSAVMASPGERALINLFGRFDSPRHPLGKWFKDSLPAGSVILK